MTAVIPAVDAEHLLRSQTDAGSFGALYDRYAYQRVGGPTSEDLVADTFLAAFQQRGLL
jgi:DNA-directed RNA polymerase specialized sigma24 family protein